MKNVITVSLVYGYSARNAGDFAITLGALDLLLSLGVKVKLFSRYMRANQDFHESSRELRERYGNKIEIYESPFCLDRTDGKLKTIRCYADGILTILGIRRKREFRRVLLDCDFVIFNGGNLFRCNSFIDFTRLFALMYPLNIARRHNKDIIVFPQSASTINRLGQRILSPILTTSSLLMLREKDSFDYLSSLMPSKNFYQTIDLAFFIDKANLPSPLVKEQHSIGITLRFHTVGDISYLQDNLIKEYLSELGDVVEELKNTHNVVIIVQCDKDYEKSRSFAAKHQIRIKKTNNVLELLATYKGMDLLIGMRLHSIILALSVGTPCFGLFCKQWGLKNPGMMKTFGMPYRFCDAHLNSEEILSDIRPLLDNREAKSVHILQFIEQEKSNILGEMSLAMNTISALSNVDFPVTPQR